jgi:hypothetical protein
MVQDLKEAAWRRLRGVFGAEELIPDARLVAEVFDLAAPQLALQIFFATVAAWHMFFGNIGTPEEREEDWKEHPEYSLMMLKQAMVLSPNRETRNRAGQNLHPAHTAQYQSQRAAEKAFGISAGGNGQASA